MDRNVFKILIAEDNKITRKFIVDLLSKMKDIKIFEAGSIKDATTIFNKYNSAFNLFLIDLYFSDGNGMDFLKNVKKKLNTFNISKLPPAIIISSNITEHVREMGKQLGVVAYFEKPFDLNALSQKVSWALRTKHSNEDYEKVNIH